MSRGGSRGENRGRRVDARNGHAAGGDFVYVRGSHIQVNQKPRVRRLRLALIVTGGTLSAVAGALTVLWVFSPTANSDADRGGAAPTVPSTTRPEPSRTPRAAVPPALTDPQPDKPSQSPTVSSRTAAPTALSHKDEAAPLPEATPPPDCRTAGTSGVELTPSNLEVRNQGYLSARVNCETEAGEKLYYMVRVDNIMDAGKPPKIGYYLKEEISARHASQQIAVDLQKANARPGSVRHGFVQLLREDQLAALKREETADGNDGTIAALPEGSVTVSGEARVVRSG
ncbi:hypothetical protein [Streptomyces sp. NPDC088254]|uniref:hypothetical protein n=1 Tax=Streptomyces sp. NPDC088254 TaxID=3365847 RepID=UPI003821D31A